MTLPWLHLRRRLQRDLTLSRRLGSTLTLLPLGTLSSLQPSSSKSSEEGVTGSGVAVGGEGLGPAPSITYTEIALNPPVDSSISILTAQQQHIHYGAVKRACLVMDGTEYRRRRRRGMLSGNLSASHPPQISPGLFLQLSVQSESVRSRSSATDVAQKHCRVALRGEDSQA